MGCVGQLFATVGVNQLKSRLYIGIIMISYWEINARLDLDFDFLKTELSGSMNSWI